MTLKDRVMLRHPTNVDKGIAAGFLPPHISWYYALGESESSYVRVRVSVT